MKEKRRFIEDNSYELMDDSKDIIPPRVYTKDEVNEMLTAQAKEIFDRLTMKLDLSNMSVINKKIIYKTRKHFIKGDE